LRADFHLFLSRAGPGTLPRWYVPNFSVATRQTVSKERDSACPQDWKESINGKSRELTTWFRVTCWRQLPEAVNQYAGKGLHVFVEGELRGDPVDGTQNPRIWTGNDGEHRASYEVAARPIKFPGKREAAGGAPATEPPPEGYEEDDSLPF
jgi:single-stranded DNA-binding protein